MKHGSRMALCSVAASALLAMAGAAAHESTGADILILQSLDAQSSPYNIPTLHFRQHFQEYFDLPVSFVEINLDARWGDKADRESSQVRLLRNRFQDRPPALVVSVGPSAIDFWLHHRDEFPVAVPAIMAAREGIITEDMLRPGDAGIASAFSFTHAVDQIVGLLPGTRRVVVVFGATELERELTAAAQRELAEFYDDIEFEFTSQLRIREIENLLMRLPDHSAVLFGIFSMDAGGRILSFDTALQRLLAASSAPVFGVFEHQLGSGIVGGRLIPTERMGEEMANAAYRTLNDPGAEPLLQVVPLAEPAYDWRALTAWSIGTALLPAGSEILFRPQTFWSQYGAWALPGIALVIAQFVLITALLIARRRRRAAELAGARLSSRLITAHEAERGRIAQELHDDLSQRLAGLAIDAGFLARGPEADGYHEALDNLQPELARISKDVHDMSYRLHPSLVGEIGLDVALQSEVDSFRRRAGPDIEARIEKLRAQVPRDSALHIFRIAQQALNNAVKHSGASTIVVSLTQNHDSLLLEVCDDGKGFDIRNLNKASGIGISSMRERARLVAGSLRLHSEPGKGTSVSVRVPL